ncbi:hypothetical protein PAXRUDRAFT_28998, partial [Paxillus rubicundulus Ve08.2h10]
IAGSSKQPDHASKGKCHAEVRAFMESSDELGAISSQLAKPKPTGWKEITSAISLLREVLHKMMGIEFGKALPHPLPGLKEYWIKIDITTVDRGTNGTMVLHPKFDQFWTTNVAWHNAFFSHFHKDATHYVPTCTDDTVNDLTNSQLKSLGGKLFKMLKEKYKVHTQPVGKQALDVQVACDMQPPSRVQAWKKKKKKKTDILTTYLPEWHLKDYHRVLKVINGAVEEELVKKGASKKKGMKKHAPRINGPKVTSYSLLIHAELKTPQWAVSTRWLNSIDAPHIQRELMTYGQDEDEDGYQESSATTTDEIPSHPNICEIEGQLGIVLMVKD